MKKLSVIIPVHDTEELVSIVIRSFETFRPKDLRIKYFVVENSLKADYKERILGLAEDIVYFDNAAEHKKAGKFLGRRSEWDGSHANADAIDMVKTLIEDEYTFICHSDVCVTSRKFFSVMENKIEEGCSMIGVCKDPTRIQAAHISGLMVLTEILKKVSTLPQWDATPELDTGDALTKYCRDENISYAVLENTINDKSITESLPEPYRGWGPDCGVDRCFDRESGEVIFMHLGRGTQKRANAYYKSGKKTFSEWVDICGEVCTEVFEETVPIARASDKEREQILKNHEGVYDEKDVN